MMAVNVFAQPTSTTEQLIKTASRLAAKGKGLLASDESIGTIGKRIEKAGLANTEENRRSYRENFYTADIGESISGVILFKEALYQKASDGSSFVECLNKQGVLAGIKVDEGLVPFEGHEGETVTKGLEHLEANCQQYYRQGARFAKWRAALKVSDKLPSKDAIEQNAQQLAEYAVICQSCGLVPIVEPELLIDGDHTIERFAAASEEVITCCVQHLQQRHVCLEACLLKLQMVIPGTDCIQPKPTPQQIAQQTFDVMQRTVPVQSPGIVFLSGGQTEEEATVNLNAINLHAQQQNHEGWSLTFSFGRGLQASVMSIWSKDQSNKAEARSMAAALAAANASACQGKYAPPHPSILKESLHEKFRGWNANVKSG
ncbi:hypothetical protein WJX77_001277 [Trebouxia sp. C0004]